MLGAGVACVARGHIPQADGTVRTPNGEYFAIGTEDDAVGMPDEGAAYLAGGDIPQPDGFVPTTPRGKGGAIRTERNALAARSVSVEDVADCAGGDVPQPDGAIFTATGECFSIGTEGNAPNTDGVSVEGLTRFTGGAVPTAGRGGRKHRHWRVFFHPD